MRGVAGRAATIVSAVVAAFLAAQCREGVPRVDDDPRKRPGYVVDSIFPPEEMLRRFRIGLDSVSRLNGPTSRDALVLEFFSGLRRGQRSAVETLAMTRAEFAWIVFPASKWSREPYRQPPAVAWTLLQTGSDAGLSRLMTRSKDFEPVSYSCPAPERDGQLELYDGCLVTLRDITGEVRTMRLFGTIVNAGGRYKFSGFGNDF